MALCGACRPAVEVSTGHLLTPLSSAAERSSNADDCSEEFRRILEKLASVHMHELSQVKKELLLSQQRQLHRRYHDEVVPELAESGHGSPGSPSVAAPEVASPRRPQLARNVTMSSRLASVSEKGERDEEVRSSHVTVDDSKLHPDAKEITRAAEELQIELSSMMMEGDNNFTSEEDDKSWMGRLRRLLASPEYELAITFLIFVNAMVIGLQFQYEGFQLANAINFPGYTRSADELWPGISTAFDVLEAVFLSFFAIDVMLRMALFWSTFFCDWFNWLDIFVVISSFIDIVTTDMFNTSVLRLLRLTKLTRSIRILKVSNVLDSLTMIMKCLRASVGTLFWSLCVLLVIQCIGAILIMFTVQTYLRNPHSLDEDKKLAVFAYYGTFTRAMLTMFEVLFANWIPPCRILVDNVSEYFSAVFILYRCLVGFAVLNVIQAVFIQRTMQVAQDDKELQLKAKQYAASAFERKLRYIFEELDTSGDGIVTWEEFDDHLKDPRTAALLSMIEIDTHDLRVFYDLLDDGDGRVDAQQFAQGVLAMKGPAKSLDLAKLSKNISRLGRMVMHLASSMGAGMPMSKGLSDFYSRA